MDYPKLISEKWNLTAKFNCLQAIYFDAPSALAVPMCAQYVVNTLYWPHTALSVYLVCYFLVLHTHVLCMGSGSATGKKFQVRLVHSLLKYFLEQVQNTPHAESTLGEKIVLRPTMWSSRKEVVWRHSMPSCMRRETSTPVPTGLRSTMSNDVWRHPMPSYAVLANNHPRGLRSTMSNDVWRHPMHITLCT